MNGMIAFLSFGYLSPNSFLYFLCLFLAQTAMVKPPTSKNKYEDQLLLIKAKKNQEAISKK